MSVSLRLSAVVALVTALVLPSKIARADVVPPATELPGVLSLDDTLTIFRKRGLDLLIADAVTRQAEGGVKIANAVPNPVLTASVGNAFTYSYNNYGRTNCNANGAECSPWINNVGITDSAAIEDTLSGKRDLRVKVARNALAAAKMSRLDAQRTITFQVKSTYAQVAQATLAYKFARDVAETNVTTLKKFQDRLKAGSINDGDLQRIETQKLESDQAVDASLENLRQAKVALAFLMGVRGQVPDFEVDPHVLDFSVPAQLRDATEVGLLHTAIEHRPDLLLEGYQMAQLEAQLALVNRQRFPDITVGANYAWGGFGGVSTNGPIQGQALTFSLSAPLPLFYQLDGERRQAQAGYDVNALQQAKVTSQVVTDVASAMAGYVAARKLVERMEGPRRPGGGLLQSAKGAFETITLQYEKGGASLTDYLDALRTYIAMKVEYFADLTAYWTAVFQLEQAIAMELR